MILSHRRIHDKHSCESIEDNETSTRVRNNECRMLKKMILEFKSYISMCFKYEKLKIKICFIIFLKNN